MSFIENLKKVLEQYNAFDVLLFDFKDKKISISDYIVIASVNSKVQMSSIASHISDYISENGQKVICKEGIDDGNWGIIDSGVIIIHLFRPEVREYYKIEDIFLKSSKFSHRTKNLQFKS